MIYSATSLPNFWIVSSIVVMYTATRDQHVLRQGYSIRSGKCEPAHRVRDLSGSPLLNTVIGQCTCPGESIRVGGPLILLTDGKQNSVVLVHSRLTTATSSSAHSGLGRARRDVTTLTSARSVRPSVPAFALLYHHGIFELESCNFVPGLPGVLATRERVVVRAVCRVAVSPFCMRNFPLFPPMQTYQGEVRTAF
ncbi:hypothetical protein BD413DRAFT_579006 [Trametes elegans]|nr:hypothetical protein BD413DRAFT_579006 [Trametes elegans]